MKKLAVIGALAVTVSALAQPNDAFVNRTELTGAEVSVTGSNAGATKEPGEPAHASNAGGMSVWWSWTAPESGQVTISTAGSSVDTLLAVYTGASVGALALVAENDDSGGTTSAVSFGAEGGTTYVIAVDGYNDNGNISNGALVLTIVPGTPGGGGGGGDGDGPTYTPINATYNGLISTADGLTHENSGYITVKTTQRGTFSSKLVVGGKRYSNSGRLDGSGAATAAINRRGLSPLEVNLQVAEDGNTILGTLNDGTESIDIVADRATYHARSNPAPQAGQYTVVFPGVADDPSLPAGTGVGTVTISTAGNLRFSGVLADGTKVSQSATMSERGQWPLYAPLYSGQGSIIGWLTFNPEAEDDIYGPVLWSKSSTARSKNYPGGFVVASDVIGSRYQPVRGSAAIDLPEGQLVLGGANFDEPFVEAISLGSNNKFVSANKQVKLALKSNGLITGSVQDPATRRKIPFTAVLLQDQGYGMGYFLGGTQSGTVYIGP